MSNDWHLNNYAIVFVASSVEQVWRALTDAAWICVLENRQRRKLVFEFRDERGRSGEI